jgi:hypothetical protein
MESEAPRISEIVQQLPQKLQLRFTSLGNFVQGMIDEASATSGKTIKLGSDEVQLIQLAALVYSLDSFLRAGTNAARSASTVYEKFDIPGFQVGTTVFTRDNENTRRGELLAEELKKNILRTKLGSIIRNSSTMKELISTLIDEISNGKTMD